MTTEDVPTMLMRASPAHTGQLLYLVMEPRPVGLLANVLPRRPPRVLLGTTPLLFQLIRPLAFATETPIRTLPLFNSEQWRAHPTRSLGNFMKLLPSIPHESVLVFPQEALRTLQNNFPWIGERDNVYARGEVAMVFQLHHESGRICRLSTTAGLHPERYLHVIQQSA